MDQIQQAIKDQLETPEAPSWHVQVIQLLQKIEQNTRKV